MSRGSKGLWQLNEVRTRELLLPVRAQELILFPKHSHNKSIFFPLFKVLTNVMRTWEWHEQHCAWQALVSRMKIKCELLIEADKRFRSRKAWDFFSLLLGQTSIMYVPVYHKGQLRFRGEVSSQKGQTCSYALGNKTMLQHHSDYLLLLFKLDVNH